MHTSHIIRTPHYQIAAKAWGNPKSKPVLAIHGWLDNAASFDFIAPLLKDIYLVAIDLPGHGLSQHKSQDAQYSLWEYARDVVEVMNALGWQRCSLLGHSLGASIASVIAGSFPERIEKIALIDGLGPWIVSEEDLPAHFAQAVMMQQKSPRKITTYLSVDDAVQARMKNGLPLSNQAAYAIVERALEKTETGYIWRFDPRVKLPSLFRMSEGQALVFLKNMQAPVCLLLDEALAFAKDSYSEKRRVAVKNLSTHYFGGGHHLHMNGVLNKVSQCINNFFSSEKK